MPVFECLETDKVTRLLAERWNSLLNVLFQIIQKHFWPQIEVVSIYKLLPELIKSRAEGVFIDHLFLDFPAFSEVVIDPQPYLDGGIPEVLFVEVLQIADVILNIFFRLDAELSDLLSRGEFVVTVQNLLNLLFIRFSFFLSFLAH